MLKGKIFKIIGGIILVLAVALFTLDLAPYADKLAEIATYKARPFGVGLQFEGPRFGFLSFETSKLGVTFPRAFSSVVLEEARIKPNIKTLWSGSPSINFSAKTYGGDIRGHLTVDSNKKKQRTEISGAGIKLGEHPQIRALGISGDLNLVDSWVAVDSGKPQKAELHMSIKKGAKPEPTQIDLTPFGTPFNITLPPIQWFELGIDGSLDRDKIKNLEFSFNSSLGSINGNATLMLSPRGLIQTVYIDAAIAMTSIGRSEFGPLLALASGGKVNRDTSEFKIKFEGPAMRPNITFRDAQ